MYSRFSPSFLRLFGYGKAEEALVERPVEFDRSS